MNAGLTRQALRRHRWAFLGPAATQCTAAAVVSMMIETGTSLDAAPLSAAERGAVLAADVPDATAVFAGVAVYMSILMVGVTMNSAIARQVRDIALLRAVGATPGQIRRSVALQAAIVAVPASVAGYLLGQVTGWAWVAALIDHGVLPAAVRFRPEPVVLPVVVGIAVATSVVGGLIAAIRPARVRPARALTESATGRPSGRLGGRRAGAWRWPGARTIVGLLLVAGGAALSAVLSTTAPAQTDDAGFFVILALCVGVGLLGPVVLRAAARVARPVLRLAGGSGLLALDTIDALSRALSGALIALVLSIAFTGVKVAAHTTAAHVGAGTDSPGAVWMDYSGTAIYCVFAAIAALNTLVTVMVGRRRDLAVLQLAGATRRRVLGVVSCEAGLVAATGFLLAVVVSAVTLVPLVHAGLHTWLPYVPAGYLALGVFGAAAVVAAGTVAPAAVLTRGPAIESAEVGG